LAHYSLLHHDDETKDAAATARNLRRLDRAADAAHSRLPETLLLLLLRLSTVDMDDDAKNEEASSTDPSSSCTRRPPTNGVELQPPRESVTGICDAAPDNGRADRLGLELRQ
jgi:hypothetical protein